LNLSLPDQATPTLNLPGAPCWGHLTHSLTKTLVAILFILKFTKFGENILRLLKLTCTQKPT
jgi:hypothetical protein